jgi:hypothetical protein
VSTFWPRAAILRFLTPASDRRCRHDFGHRRAAEREGSHEVDSDNSGSVFRHGAGPVSVQGWDTFKFIEDDFRANFPGEPTIEAITWETEFDMQLPGRDYRASDALGEYTATVVDHRGSQELHDERPATPRPPVPPRD